MTSASAQPQIPTEVFDTEELLHLAVLDIQRGHHDDAIEKLKRGLALQPDNAKMVFLLGAEHAEVGMTDRAIEEMIAAVAIDPQLAIAHFQLGLLYLLYRNDVTQAGIAWSALDGLDDAASYVAFKSGLLRLSEGDAAGCIRDLDRGLQLNTTNPSLNREMTKIRERIRQTQQDKQAAEGQSATNASARLLLDTYKNPADSEGP
ncbi:MAG: hypothetical protein JWR16_1195 [Nevskia sp.]|nr:hypothetical protein [Nevskia sp.]